MKTVIRNSYTPKIGDYCETIVVDKETNNAYIFDCDGVFTPVPQPVDVEKILEEAAAYTDEQVAPLAEKLDTIEDGAQVNVIEHVLENGTELTITNKTVNVTVPTKTSDLTNDGSDGTDTYVESAALDDYYTKSETDTQIGYETTAREIADSGLQEQIDAIVASSDVVDIVGTYAALQAYDTSKLHDNDIIKVLDDETRDDATTYYRWDADTSTWGYIGAEGPFYTKAESDAIFTPMTRTINGNALSSDITLTAADVHALPDSTVIPTVNDATLTIQKNGTTVQTFTANQASNATANITVPTKTSDITNDSGFITEEDVYDEVCESGKTITFQDAAPSSLSSFRLDGETSQNGTPTPSAPVAVQTVTGENVVKISDGQGNEQSYEVNLSLLPGEYQEVEYIESSAVTGQAINLKYYSTANTRFEIDYMRKSSMGASPVFGARHDSTASDTRKMVLWAKDTTSGEAINFGSVDSGYVAGTTSGVRHVTSNIGANLYYNGTQVYTNDTAVKITDDLPLYMFAMNSNGNADVRTNAIKLYSFKLYEDTTLTADLVPCYRVADNVIGLYDLVRHEFYQALGASTLSKGPNAANRAIELCKIGDYQDYIYKDSSGWKMHKEAGVLAVNTSTITSSGTSYSNVIYGQVLKNDDAINKGGYTHYVGLCSHAIWSGNPSNWNSADNAGRCYDGANSTRYWIGFASGTSLDDIKTALSGCKIVYPLATPTDAEITNEALVGQLETLLNTARTYAGVNNIFTVTSNEQGTLEICYVNTILPYATKDKPGIVQVGNGLSVDSNGVISSDGLTSVDWDDIDDKPTNVSYWANDAGYITAASLPTVNNATLTIQKNGTDVASFTANSSTNQTANITVPTDTSDLTNGAGFITTAALSNYYTKSETYTQNEVNNLINSLSIPTKTSDLVNDSGFLTSIPVASANDLGGVKIGTGLSIDADGVVSVTSTGSVAWTDITGKPTNVSYWTNDAGYITSASIPTNVSSFTNDAGYITSSDIPTNVSAFTNDAGYLTSSALSNYYTKSETYSQGEVNALINTIAIPTKTSDLTNDGDDGVHAFLATDDVATVATTGDYDDLTNKPTIPTVVDMTGATSSTAGAHGYVPAPAAGDQNKVLRGDGTWATLPSPELVEMSYGESNAWAKFIAAYNANCIVYCRASSNANPATGAQTRKAFMAYVNNETNPTQVEFQYYRSVTSHSDSQQGDQVFVYLLKNDNSWSVTTRNAFTKIVAGTNMTSSYSSGTLTLNGKTIDSALDVSSTNPVQNSVVTAAINGKQDTLTAGTGIDITGTTLSVDTSVIAEVSDLPTKTSDLTNDGSDGTSTYVEANDLATVATTGDYEDLTNTPSIPEYQAGDHIDITNGTISAIDYVHSENPVSITTPGTTVSGSEITDGSIAFSKVDSTQFLKLQLTTTDPGEGAALAANTLLGVYQ